MVYIFMEATSAGDSTFCTEQTSNYMYDRVKFIDEFILYVLYEPDSITSPFHSEVHAWRYVTVPVNYILHEPASGSFNRWKELAHLKYIRS